MIQFGETREALRKELYDNIQRVIDAKDKGALLPVTRDYVLFMHTTKIVDIRYEGHKGKQYFIICVALQNAPNWYQTTLIVSNKQPRNMLKTMVFFIDERKGFQTMTQCLPSDSPGRSPHLGDPISEKVFHDGRRAGIAY